MSRFASLFVLIPGVAGSLLIGSEIIYVAFLADAQALATYPWGDGLGWAYRDKYHYLLSGLLWILVAWVPYISWRVRRAVMARQGGA